MKYFSNMVTKLLLNNDLIDSEDKEQVKKDFDTSLEKTQNTNNRILKTLNGVFEHPFGVLIAILGYAKVGQSLKNMERQESRDEMQEEFEAQYMKQMMTKVLDKE